MTVWRRNEGNGGRLARVGGWAIRNYGGHIIDAVGGVLNRHTRIGNKRQRVEDDAADMVTPTLNTQFPARVVYRRRRESRRHKRGRLRSAKAYIRNELANLSPQRFIKFNNATVTAPINTQGVSFLSPMYSASGLNGVMDHLVDISALVVPIRGAITNLAMPTGDPNQVHLHFESCRYSLEIVNNEAFPVFVTLYQYVCKQDVEFSQMNTLLTTQKKWTNAGLVTATAVTPQTISVTPWDLEEVMENVIIMKKIEILLQAGAVQVQEWNDVQNKTFDCAKLSNIPYEGQVGLAGWTKGYYVVCAGTADITNSARALTGGVTFFGTMRYSLKVRLDESMLPSTAQTFTS